MNNGRLIAVENDLFSVADRIKSIDDKYKIYYNGESRKFEVRSADDNSLQVVLPFDRLDCRAVDYVRKTRIERIDELLEEIEKANASAEKRAVEEAAKKALDGLRI